jgi:magnesium and cobalt transporter
MAGQALPSDGEETAQSVARPAQRPGLLTRLRSLLWRRAIEHSVRESIAELVQEAAQATQLPGVPPELDRQERALIANVLRLRGTTADDVMIPRADIVAMHVGVTLEEALALIRREGHSRLPVYRDQLDDIAGMVHIKDVYAYVGRAEAFSLEPILRKPLMVAPQIPVLDLLLQMRQARMHLALVVDEYGGIDGLLTIEDLVETIVGDISDEHDEVAQPMVTERGDGSFDLDGRLPVEDFESRLGHVLTAEEREADIDTVGGLVFTLAGRVPARGEVIGHPSGLEFRVLDADPRRIRRLRVRRVQSGSGPSQAAAAE